MLESRRDDSDRYVSQTGQWEGGWWVVGVHAWALINNRDVATPPQQIDLCNYIGDWSSTACSERTSIL